MTKLINNDGGTIQHRDLEQISDEMLRQHHAFGRDVRTERAIMRPRHDGKVVSLDDQHGHAQVTGTTQGASYDSAVQNLLHNARRAGCTQLQIVYLRLRSESRSWREIKDMTGTQQTIFSIRRSTLAAVRKIQQNPEAVIADVLAETFERDYRGYREDVLG